MFGTHLSVNSRKDFLVSRFHSLDAKLRNIGNLFRRIFQQTFCDCCDRFTKDIRKYTVQFDIGNGKAILCPIFLASSEVGQFPTVAHQVPKLENIYRRDKTFGNEIMFEDVRDLLDIPLVRFFLPDCFDVFQVSENDIAGGFHTHILAVIL